MQKRSYVIFSLVVISIFLLGLLIPVQNKQVISRGVDSYETHRPLFGEVTQSQYINNHGSLTQVGAIIVNYRNAAIIAPVEVIIKEKKGDKVLASGVIHPEDIQDDTFAYATFDNPVDIPVQGVEIVFQAPTATKDTLLAIRYDPDSKYSRLENGKNQPGSLAMSIEGKTPLWAFIAGNLQDHPNRWFQALSVIIFSLVLGVIAFQIGWNYIPSKYHRWLKIFIVLLILGAALISRIQTISMIGGVSGGDPYNYLLITQKIMHLQNPFEGSKRLPGYPLLLIPSLASDMIDDHIYMRTFQAASAILALGVLVLLIRELGLPWSVQFITPTLLAWQKDFFIVSTRPEPYSFYTLLLITSVFLFFYMKRPWQQITFGLVLGYATMTRQEGFVLAAILGIASLISWQQITKQTSLSFHNKQLYFPYLRAFAPALLLVMPFFIHNTITFGNPIYTKYFEGERLQIVDSWPSFIDSAGASWGVISSMWKNSWSTLARVEITDKWFISSFILVLAWWLFWEIGAKRYSKQSILPLISLSLISIIGILYLTTIIQTEFIHHSYQITSAILVASIVPFVAYTGYSGFLVVIVLFSQVLIATWFHPFAKHFQQSYPFFVLAITTALLAPPSFFLQKIASSKEKLFYALPSVCITSSFLVPFIFISILLQQKITVATDEINADAALDSVIYRAINLARTMPAPIGFDQGSIQTLLYFGNDSEKYSFPAEEHPTPEQEQAWLEEKKPRTMIVTNADDVFSHPPDNWELIKRFKSEGKDERMYISSVYKVNND